MWANEQVAQFANICPDMTLPPGAVCVIETAGEGWTQPLMIRKGNSHYNRVLVGHESGGNENAYNSQFPNRKYWAVPRINDSFGMTNNTSQSQCEAYADQMPLDNGLVVLETQENNNFLAPDAIQWLWFHNRWKARCDAATAIDGVKRYRCHNYFRFNNGIWGLSVRISPETNRLLYTTPVEQWGNITYVDDFGLTQRAKNDFSPDGRLYATNMVLEGVYMGTPDDDADRFTGALFCMDHARMQGKKPGFFVFPWREWRPGFLEGTNYSDGRFMRREKQKLSPSFMMDVGFMSMEFAGAGQAGTYIDWGVPAYQPKTKKPIGYYPPIHDGSDYWKATGAPDYSAPPYYGGVGYGKFGFGGGDFQYFGVKLWNETVGQVYQGTPTFLRYRINSGSGFGSWIEKSVAESDVIDSYKDKRGLCRGRIANGKMAVWYMNKYAPDHLKKTIEFQHPTNPAITYTETICGSGVHAKLITL